MVCAVRVTQKERWGRQYGAISLGGQRGTTGSQAAATQGWPGPSKQGSLTRGSGNGNRTLDV